MSDSLERNAMFFRASDVLVGGGKKVRSKYNDGLPALWADALKKIGFTEDRGASVDKSCAGLFKFQHKLQTARLALLKSYRHYLLRGERNRFGVGFGMAWGWIWMVLGWFGGFLGGLFGSSL